MWTTVLMVAAAQFLITYWPPLGNIFLTEAIAFVDGVIIVGIGVALFTIIEIEKQLRLRLRSVPSS